MVIGQEDESKTYLDEDAHFELMFKMGSSVDVVSGSKGSNIAQIFQFDVENRRGVQIEAKKLRVGDLLLEPLYLIGPSRKGRVEYLPTGHVLEEKDLLFLRSTGFRQIYDAGGVVIDVNSLKVGMSLEAYGSYYDEFNSLVFEESGFRNHNGEVVIENGTKLTAYHIAMLKRFTAYPVRVRQSVDLELEFYLRADWPDRFTPDRRQFWFIKDGKSEAELLYSYQVEEGDRPLQDIIGLDRQVICQANEPLSENGEVNSLEALDQHVDAQMYSRRMLPINSVDPITMDPNDKVVEPGQLVIAPRNEGEYLRPFVVSDVDEANKMVADDKYSFARRFGAEDVGYPFEAFLTHYIIPFDRPCMAGCDERIDISAKLIDGQADCAACLRTVEFPPYVYSQTPSYLFLDQVWEKGAIVCAVCETSFTRNTAHALAGKSEDMVEYESVHLNMVHPSRLRAVRLPRGTVLAKDVKYYSNGEEMVIEAGTLISDELRMRLEERATSPIYIREPTSSVHEGAQCPQCFAWNAKPLQVDNMKGELGVDEVRRGLVSFPYLDRRLNRLDLVCFGLSSQVEPTSGRSLAKIVTFRKYGDEHFKKIQGWRKTEERWAFLPKYSYEKVYSKPIPLNGATATPAAAPDDLFGDDDF